ncbi:MAG TPA: discoidin domain-containing protein [Polyangiaceae bacterium]|nr:discoidin domain-containing protein [Polyangiaceae bacterium]
MTSAPSASPSPTRPPFARRAWEWIWRTQALRSALARQAEQSYVLTCDQRARIALEAGERTLDPSTPFVAGSASHLAAALFTEAIGWSLRVAGASAEGPIASELRPAERSELGELVEAQRSLLLQAAGNSEVLARALENLLERSFEVRSPGSPESEQAAHELGQLARAVQRATRPREDDIDTLYFQRLVRASLLLAGFVGIVFGVSALRDRLERGADVSAGKAWATSSTYEVVCQSPSHSCGLAKSYFFHTQEEDNPWLEIDLRDAATFSKVRVFNRQDCCEERAIPLVVEVSSDHRSWRAVARKDETFDDWTAQFSPVQARWVRLRVARRSLLHLADVRVLK